jgi:hypothetical protein
MVCFAGQTTTTTPTINNTTSTTILAANGVRKFLLIQNNSAANIAINLEGAVLTGIVPTATNKCIVLPSTAGANIIRFEDGFVPGTAITAYQSSGGALNTITVIEG